MSRLRLTGTILVILGGLVFLVALTLLPYFSSHLFYRHGGEPTLWDLTTRLPVVLTVIGASATALAAASLLTDTTTVPLLAACLSFYLFGQFFPVGAGAYHGLGIGFWLGTAAAFTMSVGSVLAFAAGRFAERS